VKLEFISQLVFVCFSDPPSAPQLTAQFLNFRSLRLTLTPTEPRQCVINYRITPTDGDGVELPAIVLEKGNLMTDLVSDIDLCINTYTFMAVAVTAVGPGESSFVDDIQTNPGDMMTLTMCL
jgi:hypothetical protein